MDAAAERRVLVGLGNPGGRYAETRHNVGFLVIDELARRGEQAVFRELCGALVAERGELLLVKPQTYMNRSGFTVRCLADREELAPSQILAIYDDIHLPLGQLRLRGKGSAGGHRGMESILESVGADDIPRLRLGIAGAGCPEPGSALVDYVLADFEAGERDAVRAMVERAADACAVWWGSGVEAAAGRFNGALP
jgi:PTH1 family peptidyl-tRNA hydrolase